MAILRDSRTFDFSFGTTIILLCEFCLTTSTLNRVYLYSSCFYYAFYFSYSNHLFLSPEIRGNTIYIRAVIGIAIGAGSLAGGILLFCVIWRLLRSSKDKEDKFEQQPNRINSVMPAIPPSTLPQRPTEKAQYII